MSGVLRENNRSRKLTRHLIGHGQISRLSSVFFVSQILISYNKVFVEAFHATYRFLYGDAMLVNHLAAGNKQNIWIKNCKNVHWLYIVKNFRAVGCQATAFNGYEWKK